MTRRPRDRMRVALLAGWLFADLLLVLFLVALAELPAVPTNAQPRPAPTTTTQPPATTAPPVLALDKTPTDFTVQMPLSGLDSGDVNDQTATDLVSKVNATLAQLGQEGRHAGFVLVLGAGPTTSDIGRATQRAKNALAIMAARDPNFANATGEGYWSQGSNYLEFQVFFFA